MTKLERIRQIASEYSGRPFDQMEASTRVFHDLALDGDDAEEFLLKYCAEFSLPTESFPFAKHFGSEVGAGWRHLIMVKLGIGANALIPLTLAQLAEWAESGSYNERHAA